MNRIRMAKMVAASAVVALATACSAPVPGLVKADGVERVSVDGTAYAAEYRSFRDAALGLGLALLADGGDGSGGNVVSSPGSLLVALAMLRAGASGESATELDSVVGFPEKRDQAMNALLASLATFDGDPGAVDEDNPPRQPVMHAANGLFVDKDVQAGEAFLGTLAKHYGTGVYAVDFRNEGATKPAIDAWVDTNTGGRIKQAPAKYDPRNTFSLLNAVCFAAAWQTPFDPGSTSDLPFTTGGGEEADVPAMHNLLEMKYAEGAGWRAVDLPYAEGFVMRLVLPEAIDSHASFGAPQLTEIADAMGAAPLETVQIQLPRWDHKSSFDLRRVLEAAGLHKTLTTTEDFNAIQPKMTITQAAQAANITVAEKGTVAAAVTQINGMVTGAPPQPEHTIDFDRPFHYQIVHVETGLPLFMGTVADPRS
ncbi:serpin family protein [Arthrobacter globiformis]|uniref:Serpin family protein n=1 Tax=Arthrobacter globiformis TaxID=1665 RepID=A0A328HJN0_ARTGO|nr:serpin family protein [Arthrobacter globiformis]RAM38817.1 serpin family protein [Arthrobacter globiformis]